MPSLKPWTAPGYTPGASGEIHLSMVQAHYALGRDRIVAEHRATLDALDPAEDAAEARVCSHPEGARDALADQFDTITDRAAPA